MGDYESQGTRVSTMASDGPINKPLVVRQLLLRSEERERLLRLCYRWTNGDKEAAEDIVQETFLTAWNRAESLRNPEAWQPWLFGIARNMCLRWQRRYAQEATRHTTFFDAPAVADDLDIALERQEITALLSRALEALPPDVRLLLIAHYVDEQPHAEIAARLGISESNTNVRLHRSKQLLRRILCTDLRTEAMAYGLIQADEAGWQETRLWCPFCGTCHLMGYLETATPGAFKMRCPTCHFVMGPRRIDFPSDCIFAHPRFDATRLLSTVRGFKPAINRLSTWWGGYFQDGMQRGEVRCVGCGKTLHLQTDCPSHLKPDYWRGFHIDCDACRSIHVILPSALTLTTAPVQDFWRRHPRIRHLPSTTAVGGKALVIRVESLTDTARLDVVLSRENYQIVEVREFASL